MQEVIGLGSFCWILKGFCLILGAFVEALFLLFGSFSISWLGLSGVTFPWDLIQFAVYMPVLVISHLCVHDQIAQIAVSELGSRLASLYCGPTAIEADHLESEVLSINITLTIKHDCDDV